MPALVLPVSSIRFEYTKNKCVEAFRAHYGRDPGEDTTVREWLPAVGIREVLGETPTSAALVRIATVVAVATATRVVPVFEDYSQDSGPIFGDYSPDPGPRDALAVVERWRSGQASVEELQAAVGVATRSREKAKDRAVTLYDMNSRSGHPLEAFSASVAHFAAEAVAAAVKAVLAVATGNERAAVDRAAAACYSAGHAANAERAAQVADFLAALDVEEGAR